MIADSNVPARMRPYSRSRATTLRPRDARSPTAREAGCRQCIGHRPARRATDTIAYPAWKHDADCLCSGQTSASPIDLPAGKPLHVCAVIPAPATLTHAVVVTNFAPPFRDVQISQDRPTMPSGQTLPDPTAPSFDGTDLRRVTRVDEALDGSDETQQSDNDRSLAVGRRPVQAQRGAPDAKGQWSSAARSEPDPCGEGCERDGRRLQGHHRRRHDHPSRRGRPRLHRPVARGLGASVGGAAGAVARGGFVARAGAAVPEGVVDERGGGAAVGCDEELDGVQCAGADLDLLA